MATTPDTRVLEQIFNTLQRLETRIDSQNNRLGTIELSVKSRPSDLSSKTDDSPSEAWSLSFSNDVRHNQSLTSPATTPSPSSHRPDSPAEFYKTSIAELRNRFQFFDSSSDVGDITSAPTIKNRNDDDNDEHQGEDEVVYSESAYSQYASRLDLANPTQDVPPLPNDMRLRNYLDGPHRMQAWTPPASSAPDTASTPRCEHCEHAIEIGHGRDNQGDKTPSQWKVLVAQRHDRAEMVFFAWDCFKASFRSSIWFASEERRAIQIETRRIAESLHTRPAAAVSTSSGNAARVHVTVVVAKLKNMFSGPIGKTGFWIRGKAVAVA